MNVSALGVTDEDVDQLHTSLPPFTTQEASRPMVPIAQTLRALCARIHKAEVLCGDLCFRLQVAHAQEDDSRVRDLKFEHGEARLLRCRLSHLFLLQLIADKHLRVPRSEEVFLGLRAQWLVFVIDAPPISLPRKIASGTLWVPSLRLPGRAVAGISGSRNHDRVNRVM